MRPLGGQGGPARVVVVALGSRGDVQPMAELAARLGTNGLDATLLCSPDSAWLGRARGVPTREVGPPIAAWFERHRGRSVLDVLFMRRFVRHVAEHQEELARTLVRELAGHELVLGAGFAWGAATAAEALAIPYHFVALSPSLVPGESHAPLLRSHPGLPALANRALWWASRRLVAGLVGPPLTRARAALGLAAVSDPHAHLLGRTVLLACDPALAAVPSTPHAVRAIGFLAPPDAPLPPEVAAFLERPGAAPVVSLGFGSMVQREPRRTADLLVDAAREAGFRSVIQRGWGDLEPSRAAPDVLVVDEVPHAALFARVAAVVHHGGAGTTHVAARAGAPQVVVPHILDQHAWADRVARLGLGASLDRRALELHALARLIREAAAPATTARARAFAEALARSSWDPVAAVRALLVSPVSTP
ncbi:MAG: glycosyltransferase family 1 protein [Deltaproteobacteria bacterium]|nr:glycosyltransferase family 1 protein [Deltaproteobacteria bacterium]